MRQLRLPLLTVLLLATMASAFPLPVRILATGDMHGWLQPVQVDGRWLGGAAEMLGYWHQVEQYTPASFLTISCGDIATGPAISTIFQGDSVVQAMNIMGYDASVLGNHEFDFKQEHIRQWKRLAKFPFLAANLVKADGGPTDLVIPYIINNEQGVKVAVIGLIMRDIFTFGNTEGLVAASYATTLRKVVPEVRKQGAQVVIVATHIPYSDLDSLAKSVAELKIPVILGAHDHELLDHKIGDTWVINSGLWWRGYSRIDLDYNEKTNLTNVVAVKQVWLLQESPKPDQKLHDAISQWQQRLGTEYGTPLGYLTAALPRPVAAYNFIVDCWLAMDQHADIVLTNDGSVRQDVPAGTITLATIAGLLPFNDSLLRINLTGKQLLSYLPHDRFIGMAGIRRVNGEYIVIKTGKPIDEQATYHVLVNDYMYNTSHLLQSADPNPATVFDDWRQPVHDWLVAHPSDDKHPLDRFVDVAPRIQ